ncbi:uncharacterized protein [Oscarella lobularis]|uniref:uncharacterized protein n=1 Tax=Oscarella lobularis TaxID=121494 RepID=UPI003313AE36
MDVMKRAIELGVSLLDADNDGNLPIHMASYTKEGLGLPNASAHLKGLKYLIQHNSPVNAKNKLNESPLFIALRFGLKKFVIRLIRAGATLADSKLKFLPYEKVTLLGDPQIILKTPNPIETMLKLRTLFSKCAQRDESHRTDYLSLSKKMESLAVEMMDKANWSSSDITDELFAYGTETEQKLFISSATVQEKIKFYWYGESGESGESCELNKRQYVYKVFWFLLKAYLLPCLFVFVLPLSQCSYRNLFRAWMESVEPCIAYIADAVTYLFFVVLLIANVSIKSIAPIPQQRRPAFWMGLFLLLSSLSFSKKSVKRTAIEAPSRII